MPKRSRSAPKRRARPKDNPKTAFICKPCRDADRTGDTHPGMLHRPGICDCTCRD